MKFLAHVIGIIISSHAFANSLFFENIEQHFKKNDYAEYSFDYKKTGQFINETGAGTLLLRKNGDFVVEIPYAKKSKYVVKYENEIFFELISHEGNNSYTIYNDPANLQIASVVEPLKHFSKGVTNALDTMKKTHNVTITHKEVIAKAKLEKEPLQNLKIIREEKMTTFTFVIKPEFHSSRTESLELSVKEAAKIPENASLRFILEVPKNSKIAAVVD